MSTWQIILLLLLGVALLAGSILLRVASSGKYEIKTIDLVFILIPLLFVGLATGKLQALDFFGVKADFSELWATAADTQIEGQISNFPVSSVEDAVEAIDMIAKGGIGEIARLIEARTEALSFRLGMGGYYGPAIKSYFDRLFSSSYLRFIVINNPDDTLFGMYAAADLIGPLRAIGDHGYEDFAEKMNSGDDNATDWLAQLPGFVPASAAVTVNVSKRDALLEMETLDRASLPVVDASSRFIGTVEREKLTASLILAVTEKIPAEN